MSNFSGVMNVYPFVVGFYAISFIIRYGDLRIVNAVCATELPAKQFLIWPPNETRAIPIWAIS